MLILARLAIVLLISVMAQSVFALDCTPNNIFLDSQWEVDGFQANHGNGGTCDTIVGQLRIDGDDVSNLNGLSDVEFVGERIYFGSTPILMDINGLGSLQAVGGDFELANLPVSNLEALSNLVSVGGNFSLNGLDVPNLQGLSSLTSVGETLRISANPNLLTLDGLSTLSFVGSSILVDYNHSLTNMGNFPLLQSVGENFVVRNNSSLTSLAGFSQLTEIGSLLVISENDILQDIDPLGSLESIGDDIEIHYNDLLQNLDGLSSLQHVGSGIELRGNPLLSDISGLSLLAGEFGFIEISNSSIENLDAFTGITSLFRLKLLNNAELENLAGFSNLESVQQSVELIGNISLSTIDGLGSLEFVGWDLVILANHQLASLAGLENLTTVVNDLSIQQNDVLQDLSALSGIEHIGNHLEIEQNQNLAEIDSFHNLQASSGVWIRTNPALQLVHGFDLLTSISGDLYLGAEIPGASFAGFSRITTIAGGFQLTGGGLNNLDDFLSLQSVGGRLHISGHGIENLNGLSSLVSVGDIAFFSLTNPELDCLGIIPLLDDIDDGLPGPGPGPDDVPDVAGNVMLFNMPQECDTIQKIKELVATASLAVAKDFYDDNQSSVHIELACESPSVLIDVLHDSASESMPAQFELSRFIPGFYSECSATEVVVPDGYEVDQSDCENFALENGGTLRCAIVNNRPDWIQSSGFEVSVR